MMDYPSWRKKPPMPQFIAFKKSYRLDPTAADDNDTIRPVSKHENIENKLFRRGDDVKF